MKQTIEIDVPDGYDIDNVLLCTSLMGDDNRDQFYRVQFKKKEPEFIEVRLCLVARGGGVYGIFAQDKRNIRPTGFVKYLEDQWRKVEI